MVKFDDIIAYFEKIARNHVDIKHTDKKKHFYRFELDEILTSLSDNINFKALILEGYDFNFIDEHSDNIMKSRNTAFDVLDICTDEGNFDRINAIYNECEDIGDEIIMRIIADKKDHGPNVVRYFDINSIVGNMISNPSKGFYGMRYTISLIAPRTNDIDNTKWLDKQ